MSAGPLNKTVKVVEFCDDYAGPFCGKLLSDFDADVIKIEKPGLGDDTRSYGPFKDDLLDPEASGTFLYLNTNKRSVTLDPKSEQGREIFLKLIAGADILIDDKTVEYMESLGLGYEVLKQTNPGLIETSITPFGLTGPYKDYKADHMNLYHGSGQGFFLPMNSVNLEREPVKGPGYLGYYDAGLMAGIATLGALYWRDYNGGTGQHIDVSIQHAMAHMEKSQLRRYQDTGEIPVRSGMGRLLEAMLPCKDGRYVIVVMSSDKQWGGVFRAMGEPEWATVPPFDTQLGRQAHFKELKHHLEAWTAQYTAEEIFLMVQAQGSAAAPVYTAEQFYKSPQVAAHEFLVEIEHPVAGKVKYPGLAYNFTENHWRTDTPAPLLGQDNEDILTGLGYTKKELISFRHENII